MIFSRRRFRIAISFFLALLTACLAVLRLPQVTLGASSFQAQVRQDFLLDYFCVATQELPRSKFVADQKGYLRDSIVRKLANQLQYSACVKSNRTEIGDIDYSRLINVVYTTRTFQDEVAIVVAVGPKLPSGLPGTLGILGPGKGLSIEFVDEKVNGQPYKKGFGLDGAHLTQGDVVTLKIKAKDTQERDVSSRAVWKNAEGQILAQGATLSFPQQQVRNETITVIVTASDGRRNYAGRSWTVSSSDVIVADNVKVLGGASQRAITDLDFKQGRVCLRNETFRTDTYQTITGLPTIKKGDILLGAGDSAAKDYILPPVKVLDFLPSSAGETCLRTEFAAPEEIIIKTARNIPITSSGLPEKLKYSSTDGGVDLKLPYGSDLDMEKGWPSFVTDCNRKGYEYRWKNRSNFAQGDYKGGLPDPSKIIPPPSQQFKFKVLKEEKEKTEEVRWGGSTTSSGSPAGTLKKKYELDANVYLGFDFKPQVSGDIGFDRGLKLKLSTEATETLMGGISVEGLYQLERYYLAKDRPKKLASMEGLEAPRIAFSIGPIPVWIDFPLILDFYLQSRLNIKVKEGVLGFLQTGYFKRDFVYENGSFDFPGDTQSLSAAMVCGSVAIDGEVRPSLTPRVQFLLYSIAGPQIGVEGYVKGNLDTPNRKVSVSPVSASEYRAKVEPAIQIPFRINSGIDFKAQILSASEVLFPPYKLFSMGKKCLPWTKWCSKSVEVSIDINKYFKKWTEFKFNIAKGKEVKKAIPLKTYPFSDWFKEDPLVKDANVLWASDKSGAFATTDISSPVTVNSCALPAGKHKVTATVYAPWDVTLKNPLGSNTVDVDVKSQPCPAT